jgi:hypothetical protein
MIGIKSLLNIIMFLNKNADNRIFIQINYDCLFYRIKYHSTIISSFTILRLG